MFILGRGEWGGQQIFTCLKAERLFDQIDINGEGYINEEEFVAVCLEDKELVERLQTS